MEKIKAVIFNYFRGRNGFDLIVGIIWVASIITGALGSALYVDWLSVVSLMLLMFGLFRILSRDVERHRAENQKLIMFIAPVVKRIKLVPTMIRDRKTHRYFICENCQQILRLPNKKGVFEITCPKCKQKLRKKI